MHWIAAGVFLQKGGRVKIPPAWKHFYEVILRFLLRETSGKKWCIFTVTLALGIVLGAALLAFVVDPHYRYREPFFYDTVYYELYATAPHILQRQEYDLLMLGTSMTRNFFLENIDKTFQCKSVKLAASGGTMEDLRKFFDLAVEAKGSDLKRVIFSLDIYPLNKSTGHWRDFDFMYRKDHWEDYRYLFSRQTFSSMIYLIKRKTSPKRQRIHQADRNRMFATEYAGKPYGLKAVMQDAIHNERIHHTQTPYHPERYQKNLYENLLPVFDQHPEIHFTVYLPPYHIYTYCQSEQFGEADDLIRQRSAVLRELIRRPNVTLHDFQADRKYVTVHEYFSDVQHFSNVAAQILLADLVSGRRRIVTEAQIAENEAELRALIRENMPVYYEHLKQFKKK